MPAQPQCVDAACHFQRGDRRRTRDARRTGRQAPPRGAELTPGECERFEALRVWRDRRAAEMGCKPFVIASNRDLLNVARSGAASPADLLSIAGFGSRRAERYGEEIAAVLGSVAEADFD